MEHILDLTGLTYLWGKIKNLFATKAELAGHPTGRIYYGTCSTTANTYIKEATVETFPLDEDDKPLVGTVVAIKYSVSNTYKTEGQTYALNVNNTGAYPMYYNNAAVATSTSANTLVAGYKNRHVFYVFNGTQWVWLSASYDTNTTYSGMTQAEVDAGTGTTARLITPARLRDNFYTEDEVDTLLGSKANSNDLATVATSGSYNDLENKPSIPTVPTNVSSFTNDVGYTTNTGTITSVKMNGSTVSSSGEADLGTVITSVTGSEDISITTINNSVIPKLADKTYSSSDFSGLGRVYLRKNIVDVSGTDKNVLTSAMVSATNTVYHIQYDYDLNGQTITMQSGCVLMFEGGSLANGEIDGDNTTIIAEDTAKIFTLDVTLGGTFTNRESTPYWYGGNPALADTSDYIQRCFDDIFPDTYIPKGIWNISKTLNVTTTRPTTLRMDGKRATTKFYTNDFSVIRINADVTAINVQYTRHAWMACAFAIIGGSIEQATITNLSFTHPCIVISGNGGSKIRNAYIETIISGVNDYPTKDANNIAIQIIADDNNDGFVNNIKIASYIDYFNIGVKVQRGTQAAWITGVYDESYIIAKQAIINNGAEDSSFGGTYQSQPVFDDVDKNTPFIYSNASGCYFYGAVWDLGAYHNNKYSNTIGIKIEYNNDGCVISGNAANIYPRYVDAPNGTLRSTGNMYEQLRNQRNLKGMNPYEDNGILIGRNYEVAASYVNCTKHHGSIEELFNPYNGGEVQINRTDNEQDAEFILTLTSVGNGDELYDVCVEMIQNHPFEKIDISYYSDMGMENLIKSETIECHYTSTTIYKRNYTRTLSEIAGSVNKCVIRFYQIYDNYTYITGIYIKTSHIGLINQQLYNYDRMLVNSADNALVNVGYSADNVGNNIISINGRPTLSYTTKVGNVPLLEVKNLANPMQFHIVLSVAMRTGYAIYSAIPGGALSSPMLFVEKIDGNVDVEFVAQHRYADSKANIQIGVKYTGERINAAIISASAWGYVNIITSFTSSGYTSVTPTLILHKGTTAERPTMRISAGFQYLDTTLGKPVWYDGSGWKDATGATV